MEVFPVKLIYGTTNKAKIEFMKKDSSTESWGNIEMSEEWIKMAQTNPHRMHFMFWELRK